MKYLLFLLILFPFSFLSNNSDSILIKRINYHLNIGFGSNLISNSSFNYKTDNTKYVFDGTKKDYIINPKTSFFSLCGISVGKKIILKKNIHAIFNLSEVLIINNERYHSRGIEENGYGKNEYNKSVSNLFIGNQTSIDISLVKQINENKIGGCLSIGWYNNIYYNTNQNIANKTNNTNSKLNSDNFNDINFKLSIPIGIEYHYSFLKKEMISRLMLYSQINKKEIIAFKDYEFPFKNYPIYLTTSIKL